MRARMDDEFNDGVLQGRYILLDRAWAVTTPWYGTLVAFRSCGDKFGVVTKSDGGWRCHMGQMELNGMYGQAWWQAYRDVIIGGLEEGLAFLETFFAEHDD